MARWISTRRTRMIFTLGQVCLWACVLGAEAVRANERHFTFTYESAVLPKGGREIELWMTPRIGREEFYSRFDLRGEFEVGLTHRLQTAFYLNGRSISKETATGDKQTEFEFTGVSSEWKYKLFDPVADVLGLALYGEITGSTDELELEGKFIADKRIGDVLFAANLVVENEWEFGPVGPERELVIEGVVGLSYFFTPTFSAGLELRNHNLFFEDDRWKHSALFLGPVFSYAETGWWVALTVLPQLPALKGSTPSDGRILDEHEKVNLRLLFGIHF